jgi:hypothetical protein
VELTRRGKEAVSSSGGSRSNNMPIVRRPSAVVHAGFGFTFKKVRYTSSGSSIFIRYWPQETRLTYLYIVYMCGFYASHVPLAAQAKAKNVPVMCMRTDAQYSGRCRSLFLRLLHLYQLEPSHLD